MSVECVGPKGSGGVDLTGYTYVNADRRTEDEEPEERRTEAEWLELQRGRKRRVEELRREAAAEAAAVRSTAPARTPRLTFNPQVRVADSFGFDAATLRELVKVAQDNRALIERAWHDYFA